MYKVTYKMRGLDRIDRMGCYQRNAQLASFLNVAWLGLVLLDDHDSACAGSVLPHPLVEMGGCHEVGVGPTKPAVQHPDHPAIASTSGAPDIPATVSTSTSTKIIL